MRIVLAVIFLSILLTGSIFQSYEQTVDVDGSSVISKDMDTSLILGMLGDDVDEKIMAACSVDESLGCSYSNGKLTITESFSENEGYYEYEADYGIPYVEYNLVVKKIPVDRFTGRLDEIMVAAGVTEIASGEPGEPLNLQDEDDNKRAASFIRQTGLEISYAVVMPGEIAGATAGEVSGIVEGPKAEFMLSEVLYESQPIVVQSREINLGYIILIVAVIVLAAFALSFRKSRKKR